MNRHFFPAADFRPGRIIRVKHQHHLRVPAVEVDIIKVLIILCPEYDSRRPHSLFFSGRLETDLNRTIAKRIIIEKGQSLRNERIILAHDSVRHDPFTRLGHPFRRTVRNEAVSGKIVPASRVSGISARKQRTRSQHQ